MRSEDPLIASTQMPRCSWFLVHRDLGTFRCDQIAKNNSFRVCDVDSTEMWTFPIALNSPKMSFGRFTETVCIIFNTNFS